MTETLQKRSAPTPLARSAGVLYLIIIATGITAEFALRGPLLASPAPLMAIAQNIGAFRLSLGGDLVMLLADVALALVLFQILRPASESLARAAMVFRLIQASLIGAGLIALSTVPALIDAGQTGAAVAVLGAHETGYDVALVFFGVTTALTAWLLERGGAAPRLLSAALAAAAPVYVAGGFLRLLAPDLIPVIQPAYLLPFIAEVSFALWLLIAARV